MNPLPSFPDDIDRTAFGWYITGFTDGEGCFALLTDNRKGKRKRAQSTPNASFTISLRKDDDAVLKLIQSYFQCGSILYGKTETSCILRFRTLVELKRIINHFDVFKLIAKKRNDYTVWREGVELILDISKREQIRLRGYSSYKWKLEEYADFVVLKEELQRERKLKV